MKIIIAIGITLFAAASAAAQSPDAKMAEIEKAFANRRDRTKSVKITWATDRTIPKGGYQADAKTEAEKGDTSIHPPADSHIHRKTELYLTDDKYRIEKDDQKWLFQKRKFVEQHIFSANDGVKWVTRYNTPEWIPRPNANESPSEPIYRDMTSYELYPVVFMLRGVSAPFCNATIDSYTLTGRSVMIADRPAIELTHQARQSSLKQRLFLDPAKDYNIVRWMAEYGGKIRYQLDVKVGAVEGYGWLPVSWKSVDYDGGKIATSAESDGLKYEPVAGDLEIFPKYDAGTVVSNSQKKGDESVHVVLPDGTTGPDVPITKYRSDDDLIPKPSAFWQRPWFYAILAVLGSVVLAFVILRRLKARRHQTI